MSTVHTLFTWLSYVPATLSPLLLAAFKPPALRRPMLSVPFTYASTRRSSPAYSQAIAIAPATPTPVAISATSAVAASGSYAQPTLGHSMQLLDAAAGPHFSGVHNTPVDDSAPLPLH